MEIFTEEEECSICGGKGLAKPNRWMWGGFRHIDPEVCAENLRKKKEELDKREMDLEIPVFVEVEK